MHPQLYPWENGNNPAETKNVYLMEWKGFYFTYFGWGFLGWGGLPECVLFREEVCVNRKECDSLQGNRWPVDKRGTLVHASWSFFTLRQALLPSWRNQSPTYPYKLQGHPVSGEQEYGVFPMPLRCQCVLSFGLWNWLCFVEKLTPLWASVSQL